MRALMLSTAMAAMMLPTCVSAQRNDGFFRDYDNDIYNYRDISPSGNFEFGQPLAEDPTVPVGSGLLIMLGAGACYAMLKKKED